MSYFWFGSFQDKHRACHLQSQLCMYPGGWTSLNRVGLCAPCEHGPGVITPWQPSSDQQLCGQVMKKRDSRLVCRLSPPCTISTHTLHLHMSGSAVQASVFMMRSGTVVKIGQEDCGDWRQTAESNTTILKSREATLWKKCVPSLSINLDREVEEQLKILLMPFYFKGRVRRISLKSEMLVFIGTILLHHHLWSSKRVCLCLPHPL